MAPRVSRYMTTDVIVARPSDNLAHIRRLMLRHMISRIVIVDEDNKPVGIVTISDIIEAVINKYASRPLTSITAEQVMSTDLKTITPRKSIKSAAELMLKNKIGGLIVVNEDGTLAGLVTRTDLARAFAENYRGEYLVGDLAREPYAIADRYHSIFHVARLIQLDPAGKVIVVDEDRRPIGVIAKRDLAFASIPVEATMMRGKDRYRRIKAPDIRGADKIVAVRNYLVPVAADIMTPDPITVKPDVDAAEAAQVMVSNGIGVLPVVDDEGKLDKIITKIELLRAIAGH